MMDYLLMIVVVFYIIQCLQMIRINNLQKHFLDLVRPYAPIAMMYAEASGKHIATTKEEWLNFTVAQRLERFMIFIDKATSTPNIQQIRMHIAMIENGREENLPYDIYALACGMFDHKALIYAKNHQEKA
jgi:hypothetical protein